jgi:hypothetical protein
MVVKHKCRAARRAHTPAIAYAISRRPRGADRGDLPQGPAALDYGRFSVGDAAGIRDGGVARRTGNGVPHRWTGTAPAPFTAVTPGAAPEA